MDTQRAVRWSVELRELLEATKWLQKSIDGDGRPFICIGLNVNVSERLIQILQTQTFQKEKIQCVAASILSRALIYSKAKLLNPKNKDDIDAVVRGIPVLVNLMLSNSIPLLEQVLNTLTLFITDHKPCMKVILDSGALEAAQSIVSNCTANEVLCNLARFLMVVCFFGNLNNVSCCNLSYHKVSCCNLNSDQEVRVLNIIKDIYNMRISPKDIYHIWPYSSCKVTATHALAYLSYGKYVAIEEAVLERLVEFISLTSLTDAGLSNGDTLLPDSAVGVVGNIVRWGSQDQIKYLENDRKLLQCLASSLPCCKSKKFRVEACRMISNIAAGSDTLIRDLDEAGLKEALCTLVDANDCDVKLEAAWAIYNCVMGISLRDWQVVLRMCVVITEH